MLLYPFSAKDPNIKIAAILKIKLLASERYSSKILGVVSNIIFHTISVPCKILKAIIYIIPANDLGLDKISEESKKIIELKMDDIP